MSRGRRRHNRHFLFGSFYLNPSAQYSTTIISAILFAGFVFSGFLLFRYTDTDDLIARGKRQLSEGKVAWAAKTFETLVSRHKDSYEGHVLLGQAYLEMGERRKAEQEFLAASSLKTTNLKDSAAEIAMSKLAVARRDFDTAEKKLLPAYQRDKESLEIKEALVDLYDTWGDALLNEQRDYDAAIDKYEKGMRYVSEYRVEDRLKEKLIEALTQHADRLDAQKNYDASIKMLKKSLRYRYLPDTLIEIAESYEKSNRLDDAIAWYRKAFDANPNIISIKLSNMLAKKGRQLLEQKQPKEAERFFEEAKKISASANIPPYVLYPVQASSVKLTADADEETGELTPKVSFQLQNKSNYPLNFLVVKAVFYSDDKPVAEAIQTAAAPDSPLPKNGESGYSQAMTLQPSEPLNLNLFNGKHLQVRISIAYSEGPTPNWKELTLQKIELKRSAPSGEEGRPT